MRKLLFFGLSEISAANRPLLSLYISAMLKQPWMHIGTYPIHDKTPLLPFFNLQ